MKKFLLFTLLFLLPTLLLSNNYCMYIDQFDLNTQNKSKIYSILSDVAYPSTKIVGNQLLIFSGKFKNYDDASKLLLLTKSRYKHAKVATCTDASHYTGNAIFANKLPKKVKKSQKRILLKNNPTTYYCLKVFESSLSQSTKEKNKINYILNRLPQTKTALKKGRFFIYSGSFNSQESAQTIAKILQREFKGTKVVKCTIPNEVKNLPQKQNLVAKQNTPIEQNQFSILSLDEKGYISSEIKSSRYSTPKQDIQKSDIRHALDTQRDEYFNGLYLKTNTAYDVQNSDAAYDIRLEFDIFAQGYFENKKKNDKNRVDNQINFYKTIKNVEILKKEQELLKIKKYENAINVSALLLKLRVSETNLNKATTKLKLGLITEYEYEAYTLALQDVKDELLLFKNMTLLKIPQNLWTLLNEIEHTKLINEESLLHTLNKDSIDLKLAKTLQDRKPLSEEWSDKLRVNLYAGVRKMYLSQNQTLVGVEAKIPLSNYSRTAQFDEIQNSILSKQVGLQHSQSEETLKDAIATYKYRQQKIKTYSYELSRIKKHLKDLSIINNSAFASYANLSFNSEQKSIDDYLQKYTQLQLERVATYKELINIMYLIHSQDIKDILQYGVAH